MTDPTEPDQEWGQSKAHDRPEPYYPTKDQLVNPPRSLKGMSLQKWLDDDLALCIGPEFLDQDGSQQPFTRSKRVRTPEAPPKPRESPQSELLL